MSSPSTAESPTNAIYVGNLDQRVTETMLQEIFATIGVVAQVKVLSAKRHGPYVNPKSRLHQLDDYAGVNYGFVDYVDRRAAEQAIQDMNGRKIFNYEIKVNWAQPGNSVKEDTSSHFHVFIGDLAPEITDDMLVKAFSAFGTMSDAHVMWDPVSGKSRGFGFAAFRDKTDAEQAIATMNGEWLGTRAIRCNWATQKGQTATPPPQPGQQLPYEIAVHQTPTYVTSVYVGNLQPETTQNDLLQPFQRFGFVQEIKLQADRGFAFVKMDTHENAANALVQLQNVTIHGRPAKLSWGKDRPPAGWQSHGGFQQQHQQNWHHGNGHNGQIYGRGGGQVVGNNVSTAPWGRPNQQPLYDQYNAGGNM